MGYDLLWDITPCGFGSHEIGKIYLLTLQMEVVIFSETLVPSMYIAPLLHEILQNLVFQNIEKFSGFETYVDLSVSLMQWILRGWGVGVSSY